MIFGVVYEIMHSSTKSSPTKNQGKAIHQPKILDKKASNSVEKNVSPKVITQISSADSKLGSVPKLPSLKTANTGLVKRKEFQQHGSFLKKIKSNSLFPNKYSFVDCNQSSLLKSNLPKTYVCKFCCRQLKSEEQLQQHIQIHHSKAAHVCYVCNHQAGTFSALMTHFLKHSGPNASKIENFNGKGNGQGIKDDPSSNKKHSFLCQKCKLYFASKSLLDAHKCPQSLVKNEYKCTYCGRTSSTVEEYRICVQSHTETPFICPNCKRKFPRKKLLDLHLEICKSKSPASKRLICNNCKDFKCNSVKELESHQKKCKSCENFVCKDCNLEFSGKECFEEHLDFCEPEFKEKPLSKAKTLPKTTRKYVRKKVKYFCSSCNAPFFLKSEYVRHEKNCAKVPSFDANENASRACSKCTSMIPIGKLAEHAKECTGKAPKEENEEDPCSDGGNEVKKPEIVMLKSSSSQNDGDPECESKPKPKRRIKKKKALSKEKIDDDDDQEDIEIIQNLKVEQDHLLTPKRKRAKKIVNYSEVDNKDDAELESNAVSNSEVQLVSDASKIIRAESSISQQSNEPKPKCESKPKRRRRRKIVRDPDQNQEVNEEQDIDVVISYPEVEQDCDMSKVVELEDSLHARRSRRKIRRKSSFMDDEEGDIQKKGPKLLAIKLAKKPRVMLKPKFRRGKYSNESNRSFLCNICDFAFCSKSTLLRHKRMHSGNPWYTCKYCGKFFFRKDVYVRHETNVHKDSEKVMFCCCYCKLCYSDPFSLKNHVMEVHKASAFLPNKPKFFVKKELDGMEIKHESVESSDEIANNMNDSEPKEQCDEKNLGLDTSDSLYKCSICSETFETASFAGAHMSTHPRSQFSDEIDDTEERKDSSSSLKDPISASLNVSKEPVCNSTSDAKTSNITESSMDLVKTPEKVQDDCTADEITPDEHMIQVDSYEKLECLLCMQKFSDKALFDAHSKTDHKLIEWYQCLVCSACGSKQDMVEHMFSHMYKVGSFVMNCSNKSLDALLPCLQLDKTSSSKRHDPSKAVTHNLNNVEESDSVSELELPPLREFGVCACMESISKNYEVQNFVNEEIECSDGIICTQETLVDTLHCLSPKDENTSHNLETIPVLSCDDSAAVADSELQISDQNVSEMMELSEEEAPELEEPCSLATHKSKEINQNITSDRPASNDREKNVKEPAFLELGATEFKKNSITSNRDSYNEEVDHSPSSKNVEPNDDASNSLHAPLENIKDRDAAIYSSDASSSSDENSAASNSSNSSEEDETKSTGKLSSTEEDANKTDSSSSDSSEDNDSENEDSSSETSSSEEEENSDNASPVSSPKKDSEKSLMLTPASVSLEKEKLVVKDVYSSDAYASSNKEFGSIDNLIGKPILSPKSERTLNLDSSNLLSKDPASNVNDPSISAICSDSENKGITIDYQLPFGQKRPLKTNIVKSNSSTKSQTEKNSELYETHTTSLTDPTSKVGDSLASTACSTFDHRENAIDVFSSFEPDEMLKTDLMNPLISSTTVNKIETPLDSLPTTNKDLELFESNIVSSKPVLKDPTCSVIKSLASFTCSNSDKRHTIDFQPSFGQKEPEKPSVAKLMASSSMTNKSDCHHGIFHLAEKIQESPKSSIIPGDPIFSLNEPLTSTTSFNLGKKGSTADIQSAFVKETPQADIVKPTMPSPTNSKAGTYLGICQLAEKISESTNSNFISRDPSFHFIEPLASTASFNSGNRVITADVQSAFEKETPQTDIVKPTMPSPTKSKGGTHLGICQLAEKIPESLKSNIMSRDPSFSVNEPLSSNISFSLRSGENSTTTQSAFEKKENLHKNIAKPNLSSSINSKADAQLGVFQVANKISDVPKSNIMSRGLISSENESLVSTTCFSSEKRRNSTDVRSAFEKKEKPKTNIVKPVTSSLAINKTGTHLGVFQLAEKMPELFKSPISKDSFARMNKSSTTIVSSENKRNPLVFQSQEHITQNFSKPMPNSSRTNDTPARVGVVEPAEKVLESLKSVISPQIEGSKNAPSALTSNSAGHGVGLKNLGVSPAVIDSKKSDMSLTKTLFQKDIETLSKESMASANLSSIVKPMINETNVFTSLCGQADELPLNLQKSQPTQQSQPESFSQLRSLLQKPSKMESEKITIYPASYTNAIVKQGTSSSSKVDSEKITIYPLSYTDSSVKQRAPMPTNKDSEKITIYPLSYTDSSVKQRAPMPTNKDSEKITIYPLSYADSGVKQEVTVPSKMDSEKITIYPLSYTDSSVKQGASAPFVKCISSVENPELFNSTFMLDNKCDFTVESPPVLSSNQTKVKQASTSSSYQSTLPNRNITQPKSAVPGNPNTYLPPKPPERVDSFFKPCSSQSPILDFSDLIQHSFENPSPSEENIFSFPETIKTCDLYPCSDEIQMPDSLTNFDSSSSKCNNCNALFPTCEQLANHKCQLPKTIKPIDSPFITKPKNTFLSPNFVGSPAQVPPTLVQSHSHHEKLLLPASSSRTAETFGGTKILPSELKFKSVPNQNAHVASPSSSKCNKCQAVFSDIGELMKHSLSCLKPLFSRNHPTGDGMTTAGAMQPLLSKEPVTSFSNLAFNLTFPTTTTFSGNPTMYQNFENVKHPFNS